MPAIFNISETDHLISRIQKITPATKSLWGRMTVAQMLAHCNVAYELVFENKHPKPGRVAKWFANLIARETVIGKRPYKRNGPTAPVFKMTVEKDFEVEKKRLIDHITKTRELGEAWFEQRESHSFGKLTSEQWNTMFVKHLEHHLAQFGV